MRHARRGQRQPATASPSCLDDAETLQPGDDFRGMAVQDGHGVGHLTGRGADPVPHRESMTMRSADPFPSSVARH